jgi:hypothetical protein
MLTSHDPPARVKRPAPAVHGTECMRRPGMTCSYRLTCNGLPGMAASAKSVPSCFSSGDLPFFVSRARYPIEAGTPGMRCCGRDLVLLCGVVPWFRYRRYLALRDFVPRHLNCPLLGRRPTWAKRQEW